MFPGNDLAVLVEGFYFEAVSADQKHFALMRIQDEPFDRFGTIYWIVVLFIPPESYNAANLAKGSDGDFMNRAFQLFVLFQDASTSL